MLRNESTTSICPENCKVSVFGCLRCAILTLAVGVVIGVVKFKFDDLKIAMYRDVANVTFHSDFHLKFGENAAVVNEQISLLFLKTGKGWKIVHEHHSPLNME